MLEAWSYYSNAFTIKVLYTFRCSNCAYIELENRLQNRLAVSSHYIIKIDASSVRGSIFLRTVSNMIKKESLPITF